MQENSWKAENSRKIRKSEEIQEKSGKIKENQENQKNGEKSRKFEEMQDNSGKSKKFKNFKILMYCTLQLITQYDGF
jgi:hypothetical protein